VSATTSGDHERAHDESTNRSAEKHRKNQGKLGASKRGVFGGAAKRQFWRSLLRAGFVNA
jgi:hypothetical protein